MVTDAQVKLLRMKMAAGKTQAVAAAAAGMSERTARTWQDGGLPSHRRGVRTYRTRVDPFAEHWEGEIVPLLKDDQEGKLEAKTIFDDLQARHPGKFPDGQLRTLQRHVRDWRALFGPPKEVIFPQVHEPGAMAAFDFTHMEDLGVRIGGVLFAHLLFVFKLCCSGWTWAQLAFGETFEALVDGLQGAIWELGGCPPVLRHDNLSAATHELKLSGGRCLTKRYKDFLDHMRARSSRIQPGEAHENGVAEKGNDLVKSAIGQALILRGSRDFATVADYESFVRDVLSRTVNRSVEAVLAQERGLLKSLPSSKFPSYTVFRPTVRRWSTIQVGHRTYSVPSRLIGQVVEARQFADWVEVYYTGRLVERTPRVRTEDGAHVDYRHIIWSLVRKPGAFACYRFREALFPSLTFRQAYDQLRESHGERAEVEYVRILHLAASTLETSVEQALKTLLATGARFDYAAVKTLAKPEQPEIPEVEIGAPDLREYDELLGGAA